VNQWYERFYQNKRFVMEEVLEVENITKYTESGQFTFVLWYQCVVAKDYHTKECGIIG
jgi:hypothetical protein